MYCSHYGLKEKPFSLLPDASYLFMSKQHRAAYIVLEYGLLEMTGITVISGEVGAGKTTLIRHLLHRIDQNRLRLGLINNASRSYEDLMKWVASAFSLPFENKSRVELHRDIQDFFLKEYASGRSCVLIVDEAQNMDKESLEELRLISNINADKDQLLQIVLVGQPELLSILKSEELSQLAQRVTSEFHLAPLNLDETGQYISHRMRVAGAVDDVFDKVAVSLIYYFTGGIPRLINTLCDYALVYGYAVDQLVIGPDVVFEVAETKKIGGINHCIARDSKDMEKARKIVKTFSGVDLSEKFGI